MECSVVDQETDLALSEFNLFLLQWDECYQAILQKNPLFQTNKTAAWSMEQKKLLVGYLYHIRGHFHDLLWEMGNSAPTAKFKEMIIDNIRDEFGGNGLSHEKLYYLFAEHFNLDLRLELLDNHYYADFIKNCQDTVLRWFKDANWNYKLSAFVAIERLDNIDYANLLGLARSLDQLTPREEAFFLIHINAAHFSDEMKKELLKIWMTNRSTVEEGFAMVSQLYTSIWQTLYDHIKHNGECNDFNLH